MEIEVKSSDVAGKLINISDEIFAKKSNEDLIHQVVVSYMTNGRQGTKSQKTRAEVSGGGKKPWRQKGTGRARSGTSTSPIWVGGGRAFAAKPRSFDVKVNRKMYRLAISTIFSELIRANKLMVVDQLSIKSSKTKEANKYFKSAGITSALIISQEIDTNLHLATRNLKNIEAIDVQGINPYKLLQFKSVLITEAALKQVEENLK